MVGRWVQKKAAFLLTVLILCPEVELAVDEPDTLPADDSHFEEMIREESIDCQAKDDIWCQGKMTFA